VRPFGVVVLDPVPDQDPGLGQGVEGLPVEQLVAHRAVEPLDEADLLRAGLGDLDRVHALLAQPGPVSVPV